MNDNITGLTKVINTYKFKEISEIILFEFNVSNEKWLLMGNFKSFSRSDHSVIHELNLALNFFSSMYENFVLLGYFNMSTANPNGKDYMRSLI